MNLKDDLDKILKHLKELEYPSARSFQDGLSSGEILSRLSGLELHPTTEFETLYQWQNGTESNPKSTELGNLWFFPGFYFLSLEEALEHYNFLVQTDRWKKSWFPVFANGGGDFFGADLSIKNRSKSIVYGVMVYMDRIIEYQSITSMIATILECYIKEIIYVDSEGYLEMDDKQFGKVALKNNPEVKYWKK